MSTPTVFVSYSHDSREHADRVLAVANRLREDGIECILDQYEESPPEGWTMWMDRHIKNDDFVLMICTENYYRRVKGEEAPGEGLGVKWEGKLIYQHIYRADSTNTRFIPVLLAADQVSCIPTPLQDATYYRVDTEAGYETLYRRLTHQPVTIKPELGKLRSMPPRERKQDFFQPQTTVAIDMKRNYDVIQKQPVNDQADFVIITALDKEAKAVVNRLDNCIVSHFEDQDIRTYRCGTVPIPGTSDSYSIVVVLLPSMGELSAANAVTDAIIRWNPQFVLMIGIAGGFPQDDLDLGDVVVADQIVGYEYGKVTDHGFKPRDRVYPASSLLLDRIHNFWDDNWVHQVNASRPGNSARAISKVFVGSIASGNKVVASTAFRQELTTRWSKLIAVEMEAEGVFSAVFDRPQIRGTLVIRGICDMADERKGDEWQEYAANAAAAFAIDFLKSGPVERREITHVTPEPLRPEKISLAKLPTTGKDLFGLEAELQMLDDAWTDPHTNILSLVAWGGVGKTALVNEWLNRMELDNWRGAERVYGWSFYSQGTREDKQASADTFFEDVLAWFGYQGEPLKSPWEKGKELAQLIKQRRTLLILDGLEPLQYPPGEMEGVLRDQGLQALLKDLARFNPGLCVITTRHAIADLEHFVDKSTKRIFLENLSQQAGRQLLREAGVTKGTDKELESASIEYEGHALALTLLGKYIAVRFGGEIRERNKIKKLTYKKDKQGKQARNVMHSYEIWLKGKPELDLLYVMGLFDRPAPLAAIEALKQKPVIKDLTNSLQRLSDEDWDFTLQHLRDLRLLAEKDEHSPDIVDCHPLIHEHFGEKLKANNPKAWQEAHSRLYDYYKNLPEKLYGKFLPDTLEEMEPLFAAVAHGCQAGRHQEANTDIYFGRIRRNEYYLVDQLGAVGAWLAVLSNFFDEPWEKPSSNLKESDIAVVLNNTGAGLRALGRLREAAKPMWAALQNHIKQKNWKEAARDAGNLSELYLTLGDVPKAVAYARQSVDFADRSGDWQQEIAQRTTLANAQHQAGELAAAEQLFQEAESLQQQRQPGYYYL